MDSQRLILFFVFSISVFFLLDAWQRDQQPAPKTVTQSADKPGASVAPPVPTPSDKLLPAREAKPPGTSALATGETIKIETDILRAEVSTLGGDLRRLEFKAHRDTVDKAKNFVLFQNTPQHVYVAQSGLIGNDMPNHRTVYAAQNAQYTLGQGDDVLEVRLEASGPQGVRAAKIYRFRRASYVIEVTYQVMNHGA